MKKEYVNIIVCISFLWMGNIKSGKQAPLPYPPSAVYIELNQRANLLSGKVKKYNQWDSEKKRNVRKNIRRIREDFEQAESQLQGRIEKKKLDKLKKNVSTICEYENKED